MEYRMTPSDELYHYGVKGMKWGVRHDYEPKGRVARGKAAVVKNRRKKISKDTKRKIAKGALIATGIIAGSVILYKTGAFDKLADVGKKAVNGSDILDPKGLSKLSEHSTASIYGDNEISEQFKNLAEQTGLKLHDKIPTVEQSIKNANAFNEKDNCGFNVISYYMNRHGVDCASNPYPVDGSPTMKELGLYMKGQTLVTEKLTPGDYNSIHKQLSKKILEISDNIDGAIGGLGVHKTLPNGKTKGHIIAWENVGGEIKFIEPSDVDMPATKWIEGMAKGQFDLDDIELASYHNVIVNPRQITRAVRNR